MLATAVAFMSVASPAMADLKFGVAAEPYAPFTSKDASGVWIGWEVDFMNAVCAEIGEANLTHFNAVSPEDWYNSLCSLVSDAGLRKTMGSNGRKHSLEHYSVSTQALNLAIAMKSVLAE